MTLPVEISGTVKPFKGDGRKFGYPTANIELYEDVKDGVYFGVADLAEYHQQPALVFVGTPETTGDPLRRLEAHLLDVQDRDYYGEHLLVRLLHYHRPSQKFDSLDELIEVMADDESIGRAWLAKNPLA